MIVKIDWPRALFLNPLPLNKVSPITAAMEISRPA